MRIVPLVGIPLVMVTLSQQPDSLSGGAGWVGAGLLGLVLCWLLLKHLPDKDKQITGLIEARDKLITTIEDKHELAVKDVVAQCREEAQAERDASDRRHGEQLSLLSKIHESTREGVHATRNLDNTIRIRSRLADAFQSTELPAWTKDMDGTLTSWNGACERLFGWKQGEVVGHPVREKLIPPDLQSEEEGILRRVASGESIDEYDTERMHKNGRRVKVTVVTSPIRNQAGRIIGASTIAREPDRHQYGDS